MPRRLSLSASWPFLALLFLAGCSTHSADPTRPRPFEGQFCEADEEGVITCEKGGGACRVTGDSGEALCGGEVPCQLGLDRTLICFQDDGQTTERPRPTPPPEDGLVTTTVGRCSVTAQVGIQAFNRGTNVGTGWAVPQTGTPPPVTEVMLRAGQGATGTVAVRPAGTGPYGGRLTIQWSKDGQNVPLTRRNGRVFRNDFRIDGTSQAQFMTALRARQRRYENQGIAFRFPQPPMLGRVRPILEENVSVSVTWDPRSGPPCSFTIQFRLRWIFGLGDPGRFRLPRRPRPVQQNTATVSPPRLQSVDGVPFYIVPFSYQWAIGARNTCCGVANCNYEVIQFARAAIETRDPRGDRGKPYSLDISQREKAKARMNQDYDPTFTNRPGTTRRDRTRPVGSGRNQALQQIDGPGLTRFRYDQLASAAVPSVFRQQFLALLVCQAKDARGRPVHTAQAYLDSAKVVEAVLYTITWTFPGRDPNTGLPRAPQVAVAVNARIDTGPGQFAYLRCKQSLDLFLMANGLLDAYRRPGPSELVPMPPMDNDRLNRDINGANSINVPTAAEVANR